MKEKKKVSNVDLAKEKNKADTLKAADKAIREGNVEALEKQTSKTMSVQLTKKDFNIIDRSGARYLQNASAKGSKHIGLKYYIGSMPLDVWNAGIEASGDPEYWRKDDYKNFEKWCLKNPRFQQIKDRKI